MTDRPDLSGTPWAVLYQGTEPRRPKERQGRNLGATQKPGAQIHGWTLQEYFPANRATGKRAKWKCVCTCGAVRLVLSENLASGGSKNCGHARNRKTAYGRTFNQENPPCE
jgi:hypothetical protein